MLRLRKLLPLLLGGLLLLAGGLWLFTGARPEGPAEHAYSTALDAARRGDQPSATESLQQAILLDPSSGTYHADLGVLYLQRGDANRAIPELQAAAFLAPDHPHVYCRLAQALVEEHRRTEALGALEIALRKTPDCPIALSVRGEQRLRDDNLSGALEDFQRVLKLDPASPIAYEKIGYIDLSTQKPDETIAIVQKGLEKNPNRPGLHALLGSAYAKHPEDPHSAFLAEQHLRLALPGNPDAAEVCNSMGQLYLATNRLPEARTQFQEALRRSPYLKDALYGMAQVARRDGQAAEARRLLATFAQVQTWNRRLAELQAQAAAHPQEIPIRMKIARMLADKNIARNALKTLDEVVELDPARREARELRARMYQQTGQMERAADESAVANRLPLLAAR